MPGEISRSHDGPADPCDRPGCSLPAAYRRWATDPAKQGVNLNEPGMKEEYLCVAHANEVRQYLGGRLEPLDA